MKNRILILVSTLLVLSPVFAFAFPDEPVEYIVPFKKDGEWDISARTLRPFFKEAIGTDLVVLNRAGAGGTLQWRRLNNIVGDGYTVMGVSLPSLIFRPAYRDLGFDVDDIVTIYFNHFTPDVIMVRAGSDFKSMGDLIAYANKHPGKLTFSGAGAGSSNQMAQLKFDRLAGIDTDYMSYRGTHAAVTALLTNEVMAEWAYATTAHQLGEDIRVLAVATQARHPLFPDVPTFNELGIDLVGGLYRGIAVPDSTDETLRNRWSEILAELNENTDYKNQMMELGFAITDVSYGEMESFMGQKEEEYLDAARRAGLIR